MLQNTLSDVVSVYPPRADKCTGDRRSRTDATPENAQNEGSVYEGEENQNEDEESLQAEDDGCWDEEDDGWEDEDLEASLQSGGATGTDSQEILELMGEDLSTELQQELGELAVEDRQAQLYRMMLRPASYYLTPGWYPTGMENVSGPIP
jgi:hypothetical protein